MNGLYSGRMFAEDILNSEEMKNFNNKFLALLKEASDGKPLPNKFEDMNELQKIIILSGTAALNAAFTGDYKIEDMLKMENDA